ncbi:MAG: ribonuclease HII [Candidatus Marsarchaeota archaeon]|nr:ribonuclease HII [Candidatus Marsarchaeota archaeon]
MVAITKGYEHKLSEIGVRDSKLLTPKRRAVLFNSIMGIAAEVKTGIISPGEINEAMQKGISLNELEAVHFARLFDSLESDVKSFYIDSPDVIAEKFGLRLKMLSSKPTRVVGIKASREELKNKPIKLVAEHKADVRYPVVSAASIIAKVTRDEEIRKLERRLRLKIGSGYPSDYVTIDAVRQHLKTGKLSGNLRLRWKTMENIKQTKIDNFY